MAEKNELIDGWISSLIFNIQSFNVQFEKLELSYLGNKTMKALKKHDLEIGQFTIGEIECFTLQKLIHTLFNRQRQNYALSPSKSMEKGDILDNNSSFSFALSDGIGNDNDNNNCDNNNMSDILCLGSGSIDSNKNSNDNLNDKTNNNESEYDCNPTTIIIKDYIDNWHAFIIAECFRKISKFTLPVCGRLPNTYDLNPNLNNVNQKNKDRSQSNSAQVSNNDKDKNGSNSEDKDEDKDKDKDKETQKSNKNQSDNSIGSVSASASASSMSSMSLSRNSLLPLLSREAREYQLRHDVMIDDLTLYITCDIANVIDKPFEIFSEIPNVTKLSIISKVPFLNAGDIDFPGIHDRLQKWWQWIPYNLSHNSCKYLTLENLDYSDCLLMFEKGFFNNVLKFNFIFNKTKIVNYVNDEHPTFNRQSKEEQVNIIIQSFKQFIPNAQIDGDLQNNVNIW